MKATEITALVTESASRFGDHNPQQLKYLSSRLSNVAEAEVTQGLLHVFTHGAAPPEGSQAHELAGQLLVALGPRAEVNLGLVLRAALARYELSVEQFPQYLGSLFGADQVLVVLQQLEQQSLSKQERHALQTMRFWLGGARAGTEWCPTSPSSGR